MKYPKLKCEDKKNTVVCSLTIKKMKVMYKEKFSCREIADKFKVSTNTVYSHLFPSRNTSEYLEKRRRQIKDYNYNRYHTDPEFRQKMLDATSKHHKEKRATDPKFKKWQSQINSKNIIIWNEKAIKKHPTWSHQCAKGVHEDTVSTGRCKNKSKNCKCPCHKTKSY